MPLIKITPFKKWFFIFLIFFMVLIYKETIPHMLFFDDNDYDLVKIKGDSIKMIYLKGFFSLSNSLFEYSFLQSFLIPLMIVFIGKQYDYVKNRFCRYYLGRTQAYFQSLKKLKLKAILLSVSSFLLILIVIILLSQVVERFKISGIEFYFKNQSILTIFGKNTKSYLIYYGLVKSCAIATEMYFFLLLIDMTNHYIKASFHYLIFLWGTAPIMYSIMPFYFVPMSHLMITTYGEITLWQIFASYLPSFLVISYIKLNNAYEIK